MSNYAGVWQLGAGYTLTFNGVTYADPKQIKLPKTSAFRKDLATLGGTTGLIGRLNAMGEIAIQVANDGSAPLVTSSIPTTTTITLTWPNANTQTGAAALVEDDGGSLDAEGENIRTLTFKITTSLGAST